MRSADATMRDFLFKFLKRLSRLPKLHFKKNWIELDHYKHEQHNEHGIQN